MAAAGGSQAIGREAFCTPPILISPANSCGFKAFCSNILLPRSFQMCQTV
jgi:hypothetical protein